MTNNYHDRAYSEIWITTEKINTENRLKNVEILQSIEIHFQRIIIFF